MIEVWYRDEQIAEESKQLVEPMPNRVMNCWRMVKDIIKH